MGWRLGRRPGLDGLRGVAILLVLTNHVMKNAGWYNELGGAGVTVFFTLSGFLISSLLIEERSDTGRISLARFYERRARRLLPALFVLLASVAIYLGLTGASPAWVLVPLFYSTNWFNVGGHTPPMLGHTWSLSVEEQFYLAWPLVVMIAARGRIRALKWICVAGIGLCNVERVLMWHDGAGAMRLYSGTDGHADALLIGCLLALLAHEHGLPRIPGAAVAIAVGVITVVGALPPRGWNLPIGLTVVPLLSAVAIIGCCSCGTFGWLRWFGRRSYAIYLWLPLIAIATTYRPGVVAALAAAVVSLGVAEASWWLVERRWLRKRLDRSTVPPAVDCDGLYRGAVPPAPDDDGLLSGSVPPRHS